MIEHMFEGLGGSRPMMDAHLLRGWAQIVGLHQGLYAEGPGDADAVPLAVAEALLVWATAELDSIG